MNRLLGAHVSAAGGPAKAVERAAEIGANCVQIFSGSPRSWGRGPLENIDLGKLKTAQSKYGVAPIVTHALYLINLASEKQELIDKSLSALIYDLKFDAQVGGAGVVVHLGSHLGRGWQACLEEVAERISEILEKTPEQSTFLIENSAGQQGKLCSDLAEIRQLLDQVNSPRLKWCVDTCHAWAGGIALKDLAEKIAEHNLWETLSCVHVNDSRDPFSSGRDRHANLGEGTIPAEELQAFLQDERVTALPLILEVPGLDNLGPDQENVKRLQKLLAT